MNTLRNMNTFHKQQLEKIERKPYSSDKKTALYNNGFNFSREIAKEIIEKSENPDAEIAERLHQISGLIKDPLLRGQIQFLTKLLNRTAQ